jgi:hypothetical protein
VTGMRTSEVCRLDRDQVDVDTGVLVVADSKFGNYAEPVIMPRTLLVPRFERLVCG